MILSSTETGREGELLTCYHLQRMGFRTAIVNFPGVDVVALPQWDRPFTVEVKSRTRKDHDSSLYCFRNKSKGTSDWIAYAALDLQLVLFERGDAPVAHRRIPVAMFTPEEMMRSMSVLREAYAA